MCVQNLKTQNKDVMPEIHNKKNKIFPKNKVTLSIFSIQCEDMFNYDSSLKALAHVLIEYK